MNRDVAAYDAWYESPRGRWIGDTEFALLYSMLAPQRGEALLDVGCGTGCFSRRFADAGLAVTGIDLDAPALRFARDHAPAIAFVQADAVRLPFPDGAFDFAIAVTSLCFVQAIDRAVAEMLRVSRRGIAIGLLNRRSLLYRQKGRSRQPNSYSGARWHTRNEAKALVAAAGAVEVSCASAILLPDGGAAARWLERRLPSAGPFGAFLAASGRRQNVASRPLTSF
jgi:SAM-dependent methyltransferase